jgi:hypothetical protein
VVSVSDEVVEVTTELEWLLEVLEFDGEYVDLVAVGFVVSVTGYAVVEVAIVEVIT